MDCNVQLIKKMVNVTQVFPYPAWYRHTALGNRAITRGVMFYVSCTSEAFLDNSSYYASSVHVQPRVHRYHS